MKMDKELKILSEKMKQIAKVLEDENGDYTWQDGHEEWISGSKIRSIINCTCPAAGRFDHWYGCASTRQTINN